MKKRLTQIEFVVAQLEGVKDSLREARKALKLIAKGRCSKLDGCVATIDEGTKAAEVTRCDGCTAARALKYKAGET